MHPPKVIINARKQAVSAFVTCFVKLSVVYFFEITKLK